MESYNRGRKVRSLNKVFKKQQWKIEQKSFSKKEIEQKIEASTFEGRKVEVYTYVRSVRFIDTRKKEESPYALKNEARSW